MSYIGRVQIDTGNSMLVGSTMFGICESAATDTLKIINDSTNITIGSDFDALMRGLTIHVRFMNGNSAKSIQLQVGGTLAINVFGDFTCDAGAVVAFTLEQTAEETYWILNTTHKELGSAAYTDASDYATAAQGTLAENAMPKSGGAFTGPVTLAGAPTSDLGAVTKKYVDDAISSGTLAIARIADTSITNAKLANSKVTIAGNDVSLGGSLSADTLRTSLGLSNALFPKRLNSWLVMQYSIAIWSLYGLAQSGRCLAAIVHLRRRRLQLARLPRQRINGCLLLDRMPTVKLA